MVEGLVTRDWLPNERVDCAAAAARRRGGMMMEGLAMTIEIAGLSVMLGKWVGGAGDVIGLVLPGATKLTRWL